MDEFLDHLFSSSSWSDVNATEKSSQVCIGSAQINGLLPDLMGVYEGNEINSHTNLISSNQIIESLTAQGTSSILVGGSSNYGLGKGLLPSEAQPQPKDTDNESMPFLNAVVNGNPKAGYLGLQLNTSASASTPVTLNLASPKVLPVVGSLVKSPHALPESDSVGSNGDQLSVCQQSLGDSHSLPSIPQLWPPPSYGSVSSLSPVIQKDNLQGFSLQEEFVDSDKNVMGNQNILQVDNLPTSVSKNGQDELHIYHMSSFIAVPPITLSRTAGLQSQLQLSQLSQGNSVKHYMNQAPVSQLQSAPTTSTGGCNGSVKPRVRARRGQATDPHSIAERLRREKISERMKNLQELVPSFNKTNKASMLDEIIEYVKFLQLQVKVLSMSRLGAAGAVVPLITDGQAEGTSGVLLSSSTAHTADPSESLDALEQEVAKLMESNVTTAMQYLQRKGLCLMPISLAAALSGGQPSLDPVLGERKKPNLTHGLVPRNNGSPGVGTRHMYSDGEIVSKDNVMGNHDSKGITTSGAFVRQEQVNNTSCTTGELKP